MGEKVWGIRSIIGRYKIDRGRLSIGNGEAKELKCMSHGHELRSGNAGGKWGAEWKQAKGRKKWDNCNTTINKIYF